MSDKNTRSLDEVEQVAKRFPIAGNVTALFGYGSGVFKQAGAGTDQPLLDFIIVVDDALAWHTKALKDRRMDYSSLPRILGPHWVTKFQRWKGGRVWFNTDTLFQLSENPLTTRSVKYGVIETRDLVDDLNNWSLMYISGRLHKPVRFFINPSDPKLKEALDINLFYAVRAALFLLPEKFSELDLFRTISSLSYTGDVRMAFAENPQKVENIVLGSLEQFRTLYQPFLSKSAAYSDTLSFSSNHLTMARSSPAGQVEGIHNFVQDVSLSAKLSLFESLPVSRSIEVQNVSNDYESLRRYMEKDLRRRVSKSSTIQSGKGLVTAGLAKAFTYGMRKVGKRFL